MTTQEIKDLISAKVAGQGSMVDIGDALPAILNGLADIVAEAAGNTPMLVLKQTAITDWQSGEETVAPADIEATLGITPAQAKALALGEIPFVKIYVPDDSRWRGFMFDQSILGGSSYAGGYSGTWGDISVDLTWDDATGLTIAASHA